VEQLLLDLSDEALSRLQLELSQANTITDQLNTFGMPGYIIIKPHDDIPKSTAAFAEGEEVFAGPEFVEFLPMLFAQHEGKPYLTFDSFDRAVDEFFCKVEGQRLEREAQAAELAAQRKIEKIQRDQEKMLSGLAAQQERMQHGAMLLETYAEEVDKVALVINSAAGAGMTWEDIDEMVKAETAAGGLVIFFCWLIKITFKLFCDPCNCSN
jgi:predicted ribosome quality control (RQC) complex YloA/Tae2 family protein